ncbi:CNNM domain-containing protein [Halopelagius longus]|uniref:Hemolysin, contains CBS domains n=1 Tax=Halopelagius longus TaxID=1236180 RepID=A0A1H0YAH7_9EURY|nr:hemolysin family protein [Halopelagius longus]RDI72378.1 HlyC/CorC family transporter [Halopelagius longus]SDQ12120.1 Hemolysin, contains CBS domains [Halopelagius longus]
MTPFVVGVRLLAGVLLILANGFFVAIEFALTRVRQYPASEFDEPGLRRAWEMTDELEIYLTSCQVGITASSIAVGIVSEPALAALFEPFFEETALASIGAGGLLAFALINLVHLTHGEQTPTYLGVERTKTVCRYGAMPLYWFAWIIRPVMRVGDAVAKWTLGLFGIEMTGAWLETEEEVIETRAQLHHRLDSVLQRGDLSEERHEEVLGALAAGTQRVDRVMVDAEDVVYLSTDASVEENLRRLAESPHTRFPLVGNEPSDFRGVVYVPAVIDEISALERGETTFEDIAAPPMTLSPDATVSETIDRFQDEHQELALVFSDDEVVGLVTATDAFETVMGELEDPLDRDGRDEATR